MAGSLVALYAALVLIERRPPRRDRRGRSDGDEGWWDWGGDGDGGGDGGGD